MSVAQTAELRKAAKRARSLATSLIEPNAKQRFSDLADKWDAEASSLELKNGSNPFHGMGAGI
jgi:hypothetical protein